MLCFCMQNNIFTCVFCIATDLWNTLTLNRRSFPESLKKFPKPFSQMDTTFLSVFRLFTNALWFKLLEEMKALLYTVNESTIQSLITPNDDVIRA